MLRSVPQEALVCVYGGWGRELSPCEILHRACHSPPTRRAGRVDGGRELGETQAWLRGSQGAGKKSIIIL